MDQKFFFFIVKAKILSAELLPVFRQSSCVEVIDQLLIKALYLLLLQQVLIIVHHKVLWVHWEIWRFERTLLTSLGAHLVICPCRELKLVQLDAVVILCFLFLHHA